MHAGQIGDDLPGYSAPLTPRFTYRDRLAQSVAFRTICSRATCTCLTQLTECHTSSDRNRCYPVLLRGRAA